MASIDQLPSGLWHARVRRKGYPAQRKSFTRKEDAEAWARRVESEQERGLWRDTVDADRTLDDLLDEYARERMPELRSKATRYILARWRKDFGKRRISAMTPRDMASWRDERMKVVSGATVAREMSSLKGVFAWAIKRKFYGINNPLAGVPLPPPSPPRSRRLNGDESARMREALTDAARPTQGPKRSGNYRTGTRNPLMLPMMRFAAETGMRRTEICLMLWSWIDDLDAKVPIVSIPKEVTKTQRPRDVPLTKAAVAIVRALPRPAATDDDQRVFPIKPGTATQAIRRARKRAGVADIRLHDMRHEAISHLIELGMSVPDAMAWAGHIDPRSTAGYINLDTQRLGEKLREKEEEAEAKAAARVAAEPALPPRNGSGSKFKNAALEALHASASAMYKAGTIDEAAMRHFDAVCLAPDPEKPG